MSNNNKKQEARKYFEPTDKIIFKAITGSHAHGTNIETSDIDYSGVYIQSEDDILSFGYQPNIVISDDEKYWEIKYFIELLSQGKEIALALLFSPEDCIVTKHPIFDILIENRHKFLTKYTYNTFGRYAESQITKALGQDKKINYSKERVTRKSPLDFCFYESDGNTYPLKKFLEEHDMKQAFCGLAKLNNYIGGYALYYDREGEIGVSSKFQFGDKPIGYRGIIKEGNIEDTEHEFTDEEIVMVKNEPVHRESNDVRTSAIPIGEERVLVISYNKDGYIKHCKEYKEYLDFVANVNLDRFITVETPEGEEDEKINGKNILHLRRIADIAIEIGTTGTMSIRRPNTEYLIEIRRGKHSPFKILEETKADLENLAEIFKKSSLPDTCDMDMCKQLLLYIRRNHNKNLKVYLKDGRVGIITDATATTMEVKFPKLTNHGINATSWISSIPKDMEKAGMTFTYENEKPLDKAERNRIDIGLFHNDINEMVYHNDIISTVLISNGKDINHLYPNVLDKKTNESLFLITAAKSAIKDVNFNKKINPMNAKTPLVEILELLNSFGYTATYDDTKRIVKSAL